MEYGGYLGGLAGVGESDVTSRTNGPVKNNVGVDENIGVVVVNQQVHVPELLIDAM
jgi:hypothetical protein